MRSLPAKTGCELAEFDQKQSVRPFCIALYVSVLVVLKGLVRTVSEPWVAGKSFGKIVERISLSYLLNKSIRKTYECVGVREEKMALLLWRHPLGIDNVTISWASCGNYSPVAVLTEKRDFDYRSGASGQGHGWSTVTDWEVGPILRVPNRHVHHRNLPHLKWISQSTDSSLSIFRF